MRASRRAVSVIACAVALLAVLVLARHAIIRGALEAILSTATGYDVRFGDQRIGRHHAAFLDVHVVKNGDPVLDAQRVDVFYALRDIFPGREHRYGFVAIAIQKPVLTITRHADGSLTFTRKGGTPPSPPKPAKQAAAPLFFTARVRDGVIRLVDASPLQADLAYQTIENLSLDASVKSDARTTARLDGVLIGRRAQRAPVTRYPLSMRSLIDVERGFALTRIRARQLPLRGVLGFFIHSPTVRFDDGVLDKVTLSYYAVARPGTNFAYRLGGTFALRSGRVAMNVLARPVRNLHGALVLTDDTVSTDAIDGTIAGAPLHASGAIYDLFGTPTFRMAFNENGDLRALRSLFPFSAALPLRGPAHLETMLASLVDKPLIRTWFAAPSIAYDVYPVQALAGIADYYDNGVSIHGMRGRYGSADVLLGGRIRFTRAGDDLGFILNARGPGASLPYTDSFAPDATIDATALFRQPPGSGFGARGTIAAYGGTTGAGTFAVDRYGVGEFGPFSFGRADGSSLAGAFEQNRPLSASAGWIHLRSFRLADVRRPATLPGAHVPAFPPLAGIVDGDLAVAGTPSTFGIAGTMRGRTMRYGAYALGTGSVTLGGTMAAMRLRGIHVDGPLGRFRGEGAFDGALFGLQGRYDGDLAQLRPFTGDPNATGAVHGDVRAAFTPDNKVVVQTTGADFAGGRVRGVAVDRVAGTMMIDRNALRIVAANGSVGGGRAVAADVGGSFMVSAPDIPVSALRGTGLPLDAGRLGVYGLADLRASPRFDGVVALSDGTAANFPVSGNVDLSFDGSTAMVHRGIAALGETYGDFSGRVDGVGSNLAYDLNASVPVGDVGEMRRALHLPLRTLEGSFSARIRVRGNGAIPNVAGDVVAPEGSYNGLAFRDAQAALAITPRSIAAHHGVLTVGSTRAQVEAGVSIASRAFNVNVHSDAANLADFDNYFDEGETLDGRGRIAFAFANDGSTTRTSGRVNMQDLRYRQFRLGTTDAAWSQHSAAIEAALSVHGRQSTLHANGRIVPAAGDPIAAFRDATYHLAVQEQGVDLARWLPRFGLTAPLLGQVDARGTVAGRWPRLAVQGDAVLRDGSVYGYPVREGIAHARTDGTRIAFTDSVLDLDFARFALNGSMGIDRNAPLALSLHTQTHDIARTLATLFPKGPHYDVAGAVQSDARITGTLAHPRATVGFDLTNGRYASLAIPRILGSVGYDGKTLLVNDIEATLSKGSALVAGSLPLRLQPLGIDPAAPLSFTLALSGLDLRPFAPFLPGQGTKLDGLLDGRASIEGTLRAPRVVGDIALANGRYVSDLDRAGVTNANAHLVFAGTSVALQALHANLGSGTLDGSGRLDLPFPGFRSSGYAITLAAHGARIDSPQFGRGTVDGTMRLASGPRIPVLSGDVSISKAQIPFATIYRSASGGNGGSAGGPAFDLAFDLRASAGNKVRVQSSLIDIGVSGTLDLTGTLSSPKLAGTLNATPGGVFSTYNRAFRVQQATVHFNPADGVVPNINLRAYAHVTDPDPDPTRNIAGSADITVAVQGPADELAAGNGITFTSNPPYSQEQILGLLLDASVFGAVNFGQQQNGVLLRGAPGESNVLLPPGVTPYQTGVLSFNQEVFSIFNGQFTQHLLSPVERFFIERLALSDFEVTVDYGGGVGYNILKQIGKRDVYANFGQTLSNPLRTTFGFTARPDATTSISFSYFKQNGNLAFINNYFGGQPYSLATRLQGIQALSNRQGFTFSVVRKYP